MTNRTSRLAPSPTGALHLGNARTFLVNWALARNFGWQLILRIEDLDGPRVKADATHQAIDTLEWLGLDYDGDILTQSDDLEPYRRAMRVLAEGGFVYACELTRKEIEVAAAAPHREGHETRFPPELRPDADELCRFENETTNYRFRVPDKRLKIDDQLAGETVQHPYGEIGDFVVWTKRGVPAYQLAVVVDDARQGVTDVVRGDDLLPSAARQELLYRALGLDAPRWWHVPLVFGSDGRRLAKRHGDTRLTSYREAGVPAGRVTALLARWSGVPLAADEKEMAAQDFRRRFDPARLPQSPVTFTEEDHTWLLQDC